MSTRKPTGKPTGRPPAFKPEYVREARNYCLLGARDDDLAEFFGVSDTTIHNWKHAHPEFARALRAGKTVADTRVAQALYQRAIGYRHKAVKIFLTKDGKTVYAPYIEVYPPDVVACIFWLKNRQRGLWVERPEDPPADPEGVAGKVREAVQAMLEADGLRAA